MPVPQSNIVDLWLGSQETLRIGGRTVQKLYIGEVEILRPVDTAGFGDITAVYAGSGLSGGGSGPGDVTLRVNFNSVARRTHYHSQYGDITAVYAGLGLLNGGATGAVTLNVDFGGATDTNKVARSNHTHSEYGDITSVIAGTGLSDGGVTGAVTLNVDFGTTATQVARGNHYHLDHLTGIVAGTGIAVSSRRIQPGNILSYTISTTAAPSEGSGGDITAVTAGEGLLGGATSGNAPLRVDWGGSADVNKVARSNHTHTNYLTRVTAGTGLVKSGSNTSPTIAANFGTVAGTISEGNHGHTGLGGGGGDITAVIAGIGLKDGGTTGAVTLNIDFGGATDANKPARGNHSHSNYITRITTGAGLTDSLANGVETINPVFGTTAGTISEGNHGHTNLGSGGITSITAGAGLSGGGSGTNGVVSLALDFGGASDSTKPARGNHSHSNYITGITTGAGLTDSLANGVETINPVFGTTAGTISEGNHGHTNLGGGDITAVIAGVGLKDGGTTGAVTLNVDFGESTDVGKVARSNHTHQGLSTVLNNTSFNNLPVGDRVVSTRDRVIIGKRVTERTQSTYVWEQGDVRDLVIDAVASIDDSDGAIRVTKATGNLGQETLQYDYAEPEEGSAGNVVPLTSGNALNHYMPIIDSDGNFKYIKISNVQQSIATGHSWLLFDD